ncbi:MAG: glutamine--fructose-6-phosphate transaminase (isomerizing) [bacterium]|nr:glutamine--fructose-6-phosphate transaminase (isomerizing) [bacterium]
MCGIFGYIGQERDATETVVQGLKRLDYRGYDSWGIGISLETGIQVEKHVGKIGEAMVHLPSSHVAIGHTRWATHGAVSDVNAHPHFASDKSFILAQNGIVENYAELKQDLKKKGYAFVSQTDTEVIVRLIEETRKTTGGLEDAVSRAFKKLEGRNTIIVLTKDGEIVAVRNGSPLVVGADAGGKEIYLSSDTLSFAPFVKKILVLDNGQMVICRKNSIQLKDVKSGRAISPRFEKNTIKDSLVDKGRFKHFMLKEIHDTPGVIKRILEAETDQMQKLVRAMKKAERVFTLGSGTAGVSAAQIAFYLRTYAHIPAIALVGAEAKEYYNLFNKRDIIIAPSQSGETADVLEVLEVAKKKGVTIASHVNMAGAMMTRMSDYKFMALAGPEICVMSTKVFSAQIAWGYLLAKCAAGVYDEGEKNLAALSARMEHYLNDQKTHAGIKRVAHALVKSKSIYLLAQGQNLQIIREGMVKLIEGAYVHAHAFLAGDLKHYAITLMEKGVPTIFVFSNDALKKSLMNAVNEVKARGADVIGIGPEKDQSFKHFIPVPDTEETSGIMNVIALQLLAYYMAVELKHNVDKPRNIAKSVTVS